MEVLYLDSLFLPEKKKSSYCLLLYMKTLPSLSAFPGEPLAVALAASAVLQKSADHLWFLRYNRYPNRPNGLETNHEDNFWRVFGEALEDLETCGQSELLREIEASIMTGSVHNLGLDGGKLLINSVNQPGLIPPRKGTSRSSGEGQGNSNSTPTKKNDRNLELKMMKEEIQEIMSPTPLELHKMTIYKDPETEDFGFSVSDGLLEKGVYVNMIRPDGPAAQSGLKPYDRVLQVNRIRTRDFDCCLAVPLISEAGDKLDLVISRNPLISTNTRLEDHGDHPGQQPVEVKANNTQTL